jgi:hypothetical protein
MADTTQTFRSGLWNGVRNTTEPFDDTPNLLQDATNMYIPDPEAGSGAFGRPAFRQFPSFVPSPGGAVPPFGQTINGVFYGVGQGSYGTANGTSVFFFGGVMYVSGYPLSVTAASGVAGRVCITTGAVDSSGDDARVYVTQIDKYLVVNDGVFTPWVYDTTTNLASVIDAFPAVVNLSTDALNTRVAIAAQQMQLLDATGKPNLFTVPASTANLPAGTLLKNTWGAFRVTYTVAGGYAIDAAPATYTTGYATEALAIAALDTAYPAVTQSSTVWNVGYFTIQADASHDFVAGTTPLILAGAYPPGHCQALHYYAGRAAPWQAFGNPVVFSGAVFFIYATDRKTLLWSEPNDPFTGYQQSDYDNAWTLAQTSNDYLWALAATNVALYYFREYSIGALQGAPGVDFRNTATHDSVSYNIGCTSAASICLFGQWVYFADAMGRTHRFSYGSPPDKLWLQARAMYEDAVVGTGSTYGIAPRAFLDPNLNVYVVFPWSVAGGTYPTIGLAYDAMTGRYMGRWVLAGSGSAGSGFRIDTCGTLQSRTSYTDGVVGVLLGGSTGATHGYLWVLMSMPQVEAAWATPVPLYADSTPTVTYGQTNSIKTNRLGYSTTANYTLGQVRLVLDSNSPTIPAAGVSTNISVTSPNGVYADWAAVTAPDSYDGVNLATFLGSGQVTGRAFQVTASNNQTSAQWVCYRVEADVVAGRAYTGER